jgi:SAM-dependent methyltransferase
MAGTLGAEVLTRVRHAGGNVLGVDVADCRNNPYLTEFHRILSDGTWPVSNGCVDVIFSDWVLEHVTDPARFLGECGRVLRPGGVLVARTLQKWSVAGIGARLVPNQFHPRLVGLLQPGMSADEVFPTALRVNTRSTIRQLCARSGLRPSLEIYGGLDGYGAGSRTMRKVLGLIERGLPAGARHTLLVRAVKVD